MRKRVHSADLAAIKNSTDLAAVVRSRGIELKRKGENLFGICPFHKEDTGSFVVTPSKNLFHCFGCKAAGSVVDFVMRFDKVGFKEATERLLKQSGVTRSAVVEERKAVLSAERVRQLLERVVAVYEQNFHSVPEGRAYLEKRGITDGGLWKRHRIGYCNGRLIELLPQDGQIKSELKEFGILLANGEERFTGCVVFPVLDLDGNITTLYGRYSGEEPGKKHFFLPGRPTGIWNAAAMKTYHELIVVESVLDALSVELSGSSNVIGIQGVHGLGEEGIELLKQHGVGKLRLLLDGDEAGREAAERLGKVLSEVEGLKEKNFVSCETLALPDEHDPNSYLVEHGSQKLSELLTPCGEPASQQKVVSSSVQMMPDGFAVVLGLRRYEIRGLEKNPRKLKATVRVEHGGKLHVDTLDFYSARARRQLAQDLTRIFEENVDAIEADIVKVMTLCERREAVEIPLTTPVEAMASQARKEAEEFGKARDLIDRILADYERCGLIGEKANKLLCYLASISRKMEKPLSVLILSSSGAGKTALQDTALLFCPPEDLVKLTSLSGKALFYKEQLSLKHKVLALEEGDGMAEATYAIRNLISAGELVIESTIKDLQTGKLTTMENRVEGPTVVFITTTDPDTDPETRSRFFVISVDESREQTRAILEFQRKRQMLPGLSANLELEPILQKHRNFQRLLKPYAVVNPYADQLCYGDDRLQGRRDQPKYLNLINAITLLRQMQKEVKGFGNNGTRREFIEVDLEDIRLANELATEILGHSLDELSRPSCDLLMQLEKLSAAKSCKGDRGSPAGRDKKEELSSLFSRREIREFTGWSNARVHRYLKELVELEYVTMETGRNGMTHRYRLAYEGQGKDGRKFFLGLKAIEQLKPPYRG